MKTAKQSQTLSWRLLTRVGLYMAGLGLSAGVVLAQNAAQIGPLPLPGAVYQGPQGSDAFSAIHYLGNARIIAGKRSSQAANRFLLSVDMGQSWKVVGCPSSTGSHTYFFGQNGATVFSGTGDTGGACLMKSEDAGETWTVALSAGELSQLVGSANAQAVFSPVYLGQDRWLVNVKSFDTPKKVIFSSDNGNSWYAPDAQPGQGPTAWARQMIRTSDDVLLWPSATTNKMYRSTDLGRSWSSVLVPGAFLFQPLCDAGGGVYLCGEATATAGAPIRLYRSVDLGVSWTEVLEVNLQRPTTTYWRDVLEVGGSLLASACCVEGTSNERFMELYWSRDKGSSWTSLGNPYQGPFGGMQAIYQMCATESRVVFAGCQPDSTILRWKMPRALGTADLDDDGTIGPGDFALLLRSLSERAASGEALLDLDGDGSVTTNDLVLLKMTWESRR